MAQQHSPQAVASLRAVTYRLSSTPTKQLPHISSQIAASLWNCKEVLSAPQQSTKSNSEVVTLVHRFNTHLSSLLQDRTIEGRWAAVVLVKAAIEAGGVETLSKSATWVRSLIAILKKPDPPTTRNFAVIALTRIFVLTWDYSILVREITTPNLPTFISTCLSNVENRQRCSASILQTVLEAFSTLLPRHPTIFRTHESQIRSLLLRILSTSSMTLGSDMHYTEDHKSTAQQLFVLLHHCAPKQGGAARWNETVTLIVSSAHSTCDHLFRSIIEDWSSTSGTHRSTNASNITAGEMELDEQDALGFSAWKGIFAGGERLVVLLGILQRHIATATASSVTVPIGLIIDLLNRVFSVTIPKSGNMDSSKINAQISRNERELMFSILPNVHSSALQLVNSLISRFGASITSTVEELLELTLGVFSAERTYVDIRVATYRTVRSMLELVGPSMSKDQAAELALVVKASCNDLLPVDADNFAGAAKNPNGVTLQQQTPTTDLSLASKLVTSSHPIYLEGLSAAAGSFLVTLFTKVNPAHLPRKLRAQMERTAVLTKHREALVACVMNPAKKVSGTAAQASLLPLLARMYPDSEEVEALLRPRMPVILTKMEGRGNEVEYASEDEDSVVNGAIGNDTTHVEEHLDGGREVDMDDSYLMPQRNANDETTDAEEDQLYTVTPPPIAQQYPTSRETLTDPSLAGESGPAKRPAAEPLDESVSAKRLRAPVVAEALEPESARSLPRPDPVPVQTSAPVTVAVEPVANRSEPSKASLEAATLPPHPPADIIANSSIASTIMPGADRDDDDLSDSEIPQLDMGSDTDPEDEDEED